MTGNKVNLLPNILMSQHQQPMVIESGSVGTIGEFLKNCKPKEERFDCLIIDYVDLLPIQGRNIAKVDCEKIARQVKALAKKYNVTTKDFIGR